MIKPLHSRLLLRPLPRPRISETILAPDLNELENDETPRPAEVIALGPENRDKRGREIPWNVALFDRVLITPFMGAPAGQDDDGAPLLIMREDAIIGIIEP